MKFNVKGCCLFHTCILLIFILGQLLWSYKEIDAVRVAIYMMLIDGEIKIIPSVILALHMHMYAHTK